jgi:hypothetical protein
MHKNAIQQSLRQHHEEFLTYLGQLSPEEYTFHPPGKWSAGQQQEHIRRSVQALNQGLLVPKFAIRQLFGEANRPSRSYDELVDRYRSRLVHAGTAPRRFAPPFIPFEKRDSLGRALRRSLGRLERRLRVFRENELDLIILPHPLLGKVTLREMLYFTCYHVQHHQAIIARQLAARREEGPNENGRE